MHGARESWFDGVYWTIETKYRFQGKTLVTIPIISYDAELSTIVATKGLRTMQRIRGPSSKGGVYHRGNELDILLRKRY